MASLPLILTLAAPDPDSLDAARQAAAELGVQHSTWLEPQRAIDCVMVHEDAAALKAQARAALAPIAADWALQPEGGRRKALLCADMDSTITQNEGLDELAALLGVEAEVAAITERAMKGELDFEAAIEARVGLMAGTPWTDAERVHDERITMSPGARALVRTMAAHDARCVLTTGGFDVMAEPVARECGFHAVYCNRFETAHGKLTGRALPPIFGREGKLKALLDEAALLGVDLFQTTAVGDGANDLDMIAAAGLGVGYRPKPVLAEGADACIVHTDLRTLLYFQGYSADSIASDEP